MVNAYRKRRRKAGETEKEESDDSDNEDTAGDGDKEVRRHDIRAAGKIYPHQDDIYITLRN